MLICQHRVNSLEALLGTPHHFGVEVDIRSNNEFIYIAHDPFVVGIKFEEWLDSYEHSFLIANVKEEGLEGRLRVLFKERGITAWAFLDQSFPFLIKELKEGNRKTMVRVSEFENIQTALSLDPKPEWLWLDSFLGIYPKPESIIELSQAGYKFMAVSPELHGREPSPEIEFIKSLFAEAQVLLDGACTKVPELWV